MRTVNVSDAANGQYVVMSGVEWCEIT